MRNGFAPRRITPPAKAPVTRVEAKAHLRVEHSDEDATVDALIAAAVAHLDGWQGVLGRCMITQGWEMRFTGWPADRVIEMPFPDCASPVITCIDPEGAEQTLAGSGYLLVEAFTGSQIAMFSDLVLPALKTSHPAPVKITFTAGFGVNESDVPAAIRHALLILIGDMWLARESFVLGARVSETRSAATVEALIGGFRRSGLAGI